MQNNVKVVLKVYLGTLVFCRRLEKIERDIASRLKGCETWQKDQM